MKRRLYLSALLIYLSIRRVFRRDLPVIRIRGQKEPENPMAAIRKRSLFAALLMPLVLWLLVSCAAGYRQRAFDAAWARIHTGMSKDEVRQLLGEPDTIYAAGTPSNSLIETVFTNFLFDSTFEKWAYGRRRLIAVAPTFPYIGPALDGFIAPEVDDHVIYFTGGGTVLSREYPYRGGAIRRHK
jgi:hypothetical protein